MADEPEQLPSFERRAPVVPERPVGIEEPDGVRLLRFAGVVFRVMLLPVVDAVVHHIAVAGTGLAEARDEAEVLASARTPRSSRRSEAMAVGGRAMHAPGEQMNPPPAVPFGIDPPCGRPCFELVRPQVRNEQVGSAAPIGTQSEP